MCETIGSVNQALQDAKYGYLQSSDAAIRGRIEESQGLRSEDEGPCAGAGGGSEGSERAVRGTERCGGQVSKR